LSDDEIMKKITAEQFVGVHKAFRQAYEMPRCQVSEFHVYEVGGNVCLKCGQQKTGVARGLLGKCRRCGAKKAKRSPVLGACRRCFEELEAAALDRGWSLSKRSEGDSDERQLYGTRLWFWRGTWRIV